MSEPSKPVASRQGFDVFLSHNSKDKSAVGRLKQSLVDRDLKVWLDEDELRPGIPWQRLLEDGVRASRSVLVLVGKDGLGPWETEEMEAALQLAVKNKLVVIPVLLPKAPGEVELPLFLGNRTWVDLRPRVTPKKLDLLVWGITGQKVRPSGRPAGDEATPRVITISRSPWRRWQWSLLAALLLGVLAFAWIWWTWYRPSKLYEKGREAMAELDALRAQEYFERALEQSDHPLVRSALAEALMSLGKNADATEEAKKAFDGRKRLSHNDQLLVQARYKRITGEWNETIQLYTKLQKTESGEVEYVLRVAEAQIALRNCQDALANLERRQKTSMDPRLDLTEAKAAYRCADYSRQRKAASRVLEKAKERRLDPLAVEGLIQQGLASYKLGDTKTVLDYFHKAESLSKGNLSQAAQAQNAIAYIHFEQGNLTEARKWYERARNNYHVLGDEQREATQRNALASIYYHEGELGKAAEEYTKAIALYDGFNLRLQRAQAIDNLAEIFLQRGDLAKAAEHLGTAIGIYEDAGEREPEAELRCVLSKVHLENLELELAKDSLSACRAGARDVGTPYLEADSLFFQGNLFFYQGNLKSAWEKHQSAQKLYKDLGVQGEIARSELALAGIQLERNLPMEAKPRIDRASKYFRQQGALDEKAIAEVFLARTYLVQGLPQRALSSIDGIKGRLVQSEKQSEDLTLQVQAALVEARALGATGKIPDARQILQRQLNDVRNRNHPRLRMETRLAQGEIEALYGDRNQGRELLSLVEEDARERGFKLVETRAARLRAAS